MRLDVLNDLAFQLMANRYTSDSHEKGEKYYHGQRVAKLAVRLRKHLFPDDPSHDEILTVAAWFHDIMNGCDNHNAEGAKKAREILAPHVTAAELDEISHLIGVHDDRRPDSGHSNLIKLHQDADLLDHFGLYDIWRSFIYALPHDQSLPETLTYMRDVRPTLNDRYRGEMNFELSRRIYDDRMAAYDRFVERFDAECRGEIWNEADLLEVEG